MKRTLRDHNLSMDIQANVQSKANNKNGLLPSQMGFVKSSILFIFVDIQAHYIREQEKRAY